jgi:hypothetical protein
MKIKNYHNMNRRNFLKGTLFGFIGAVICPKDLFSTPIVNENNELANNSDNIKIPKDLIRFAKDFSGNFKRLSNNGVYGSRCGKYQIKYVDYLRDTYDEIQIISTPYRVSNSTGIMEFSKLRMKDMPQSIIFNGVIWCYLIYKNPSDYIGADMKSIKLSIENGFSKKELFNQYCNIFKDNLTEFNMDRIKQLSENLK